MARWTCLVLIVLLGWLQSVAGEDSSTTKPQSETRSTSAPATGKSLPLILESSVDRAQVTTKESVTYTVTLKSREDLGEIKLPDIGGTIQGFRITQFGSEDPIQEDGYVITKKWYKLRADLSGSYVLPPVEITYPKKDGSVETAKTSEIFVEVLKPGAPPPKEGDPKDEPHGDSQDPNSKEGSEPSEGLRDIRPPVSLGIHPYWLVAIGGALLAAVATLLGWYFWRRRSQKIVIEPPRPAHEVALARLEQLKARFHSHSIDLKAYHFELSEVLRQYLEAHLNLPLTDRTTEEITEMLSSASLAPDLSSLSLETLRKCDVVKFTDHLPSQERALALNDDAHRIVQETMPKNLLAPDADDSEDQEESVL